MANENWMRTYTMRCGKMGKQGFEIGNVNSVTEDCLHVSFSVEKSSEESQNDAKVQIWNLSPKNLSILESKDCVVELKAGYGKNRSLIFVGNVSSAITTLDNADRLTELTVVDGLVELRDTNISVSINGKVNCKTVYQKIANAMGVSVKFAGDLSYATLPNGFSYVGKAKGALQKVANCCGHKWSIQNQVLHVTWPGRSITTQGYLLSADTGLINIPKRITIGSGDESKTGWEVEYLLNGAIGVNDIVELRSKTASGYFLVYKVTMDGDNMGGDWLCTAQLLKIAEKPKMDKKAESGSSKKKSSGSGSSSGGTIKKGDKVKVIRTVKSGSRTKGYQYSGGMFTCYYSVYDVIQVKGDRVVIGIGSTVTAAVKMADLAKV